MINSVFPVLVPAIGAAAGLKTTPISVFTGLGGVADWQQAFPPSCANPSPWKPCAWFCDAQSCDQCHPNDNVRRARYGARPSHALAHTRTSSLPPSAARSQGYTQLAMTVKAGLGL